MSICFYNESLAARNAPGFSVHRAANSFWLMAEFTKVKCPRSRRILCQMILTVRVSAAKEVTPSTSKPLDVEAAKDADAKLFAFMNAEECKKNAPNHDRSRCEDPA